MAPSSPDRRWCCRRRWRGECAEGPGNSARLQPSLGASLVAPRIAIPRSRRVLCAMAWSACATSITLRDWVYADDQVRYRVGALPSAWRPIEVPEGQVSFHDPQRGLALLAVETIERM